MNLGLRFPNCIQGRQVLEASSGPFERLVRRLQLAAHSSKVQQARTEPYCTICFALKSPALEEFWRERT